MNILVRSMLCGLIVTILILFLYQRYFTSNKQLYKVDYTLHIEPDDPNEDTTSLLDQTARIVTNRMKTAGYDYTLSASKGNDLNITVTGVDDTFFVADIIKANPKIEFREVYTLDQVTDFFQNATALGQTEQSANKEDSSASVIDADTGGIELKKFDDHKTARESGNGLMSLISITSPTEDEQGRKVFPPSIGAVKANDTAEVNKIINNAALDKWRKDGKFYYGAYDMNTSHKNNKDEYLFLYMIRTRGQQKSWIGNDDIADARADLGPNNQPEVVFQFTREGSGKWEIMTRHNVGHSLAIIFNDKVISAPTVISPITGGTVSLSGGYTVDEVQEIAMLLRSGTLPATLTLAAQNVSPNNTSTTVLLVMIGIVGFVITSGLTYIILKMLNNRQKPS